MITNQGWKQVTLTGGTSTTIQNRDTENILVYVGATPPASLDVGFVLYEGDELTFEHTGDNLYVKSTTDSDGLLYAEGETTLGEVLATPSISPTTGSYVGAQTITITDNSGESADIYYTINGINPSKGNGTLYTGTFDVGGLYNEGVITVKAIAVKSGFFNSEVQEEILTIS